MTVLIVAEHDHQQLSPCVAHVLSAALTRDERPWVAVAGFECQAVVQQIATLAGVERVLVLDHPDYKEQWPDRVSQWLVSLSSHYDCIMAASSVWGRGVLPRVAALLDCPQISDVTRILSEDTVEHPIYAGHVIETVRVVARHHVFTVRATAFDPIRQQQAPCRVDDVPGDFCAHQVQFLGRAHSDSSRPELTAATCVVSGGRGLQSVEKFKLMHALADALGAAVGATRGAVDAGFISNDHQVGQTGKIVAPTLYVAVGLSGAVQHVAGMSSSKVIVAINQDENAPIFQVADYGLVGDLFELVPELIEHLTQE